MAKVKRTIKQVIKIRVSGPDAASCRELLDRAGKRAMSIANDKAARTLRDAAVEATGNEILRRYESGLDRALQKGLDQEADAFNRSRSAQWGAPAPDSGYAPPFAEDIVNATRARSKRIDELLDLLLRQGAQPDQFGPPTQYAQLTGPNANATDAGGAAVVTDAPHPFKEEDVNSIIKGDGPQNEDHAPGLRVVSFYKLAKRYAEANDVDLALVLAIIHEESRGKSSEKNGKGFIGLMQLNYRSAQEGGLDITEETEDMLLDAETNIKAGCGYLRKLRDHYKIKDLKLLISAYTRGPNEINNMIRSLALKMTPPCVIGKYPKDVEAFMDNLSSDERKNMVNDVLKNNKHANDYVLKVYPRIQQYESLIKLKI